MKLFGVTRERAHELEEFFRKHNHVLYLEYVDGLVYDISISRSTPIQFFYNQENQWTAISFEGCKEVFNFDTKDFFKIEIMWGG